MDFLEESVSGIEKAGEALIACSCFDKMCVRPFNGSDASLGS